MLLRPLDFFDDRKLPIDTLVLHSMAHPAAEGIEKLEMLHLSSHYVVDYDGTVFQCVSEDKRAWHAGVSYWRGATDLNSCSIGIEVCHRSLGQSRFNRRQTEALIGLCRDIIKRHRITPEKIVGHSDIAPERKADPGKDFPWRELAAHNIGIWYGSRFAAENDACKMLSNIGYKTDSPQAEAASAYAFCRRFLPKKTIKLPVKKLADHPYPADCGKLFSDPEFLNALQNIYLQYQIYSKISHPG